MLSKTETQNAIRRPSVVEDIIEKFKQDLIHGELHPGQRLPSEGELAQQFGVGRGAIRESMKMLAAMGVVDIQRGDGTYVVDKTSPTLLSPLVFAILLESGMSTELLELRSLIQAGYCQLASHKATDRDYWHIEQAMQAWETYARLPDRDVDQLTRLDLDFHYAILEATHNPLVIKIGRTVEEIFFASIRTTLSKMGALEWGIEGHRQILDALKTKDDAKIHCVVLSSLGFWGKEVETQPK
jgi:GntR family transcriptional regulator, transcriptional repressor for pyruvate dehydrogenase complex